MDYRDAGVDISAADAAKERIKTLARGTFNPGVLSEIGSFGGLFRPDFAPTRSPCWSPRPTASAPRSRSRPGRRPRHRRLRPRRPLRERHPGAGRRAAVLPRLLRPRPDGRRTAWRQVVAGIARAASEFGCALLGGETAEMPGIYAPRRLRPGRLHRRRRRRGARRCRRGVARGRRAARPAPRPACTRTATRSRARCFRRARAPGCDARCPSSARRVGDGAAGAAPHLPARRSSRSASSAADPRARPHHGRRLSRQHAARAARRARRAHRRGSWPVPPLFRLIQQRGAVADDEMFRTFNMGIGMVVVVAPEDLHEVEHSLDGAARRAS